MKRTRFLLMLALCLVLFCVSALAADPTSAGIYGAAGESNITLTVQNENKQTVSAEATYGESYPNFCAGAVRVAVDYTAAENGKEYLLVVTNKELGTKMPTKDDIVYIDQVTTASGKASFNAYPASLGKQTYHLYLSSSASSGYGTGGLEKVGSFSSFAPYILGDVNGDGSISLTDALMVLNHLAENIQLTTHYEVRSGVFYDAYDAANVSKSNMAVTLADALMLLNYLAENITSFD